MQNRNTHALLIALVVFAAPALSLGQAFAQEGALSGRWHHEGEDTEDARRVAAIERVTENFGFRMRRRARARLRELTQPAAELVLRDEGARVLLTLPERRLTLPTDGTPTQVQGANGPATLRASRRGGDLVVRAESEGVRTTRYRLSGDGQRLTLEVRITSERLPEPLRYSVTYVRR